MGTRYMRLERHVDGFAAFPQPSSGVPHLLRHRLPADRPPSTTGASRWATGSEIAGSISTSPLVWSLIHGGYEDAAEMAGRMCFIIAGTSSTTWPTTFPVRAQLGKARPRVRIDLGGRYR